MMIYMHLKQVNGLGPLTQQTQYKGKRTRK